MKDIVEIRRCRRIFGLKIISIFAHENNIRRILADPEIQTIEQEEILRMGEQE